MASSLHSSRACHVYKTIILKYTFNNTEGIILYFCVIMSWSGPVSILVRSAGRVGSGWKSVGSDQVTENEPMNISAGAYSDLH